MAEARRHYQLPKDGRRTVGRKFLLHTLVLLPLTQNVDVFNLFHQQSEVTTNSCLQCVRSVLPALDGRIGLVG